MNWRDKDKLIKSGFIILRERDFHGIAPDTQPENPYRIYYCSSDSAWAIYNDHRYPTKAARRRAMDELLKEVYIIED